MNGLAPIKCILILPNMRPSTTGDACHFLNHVDKIRYLGVIIQLNLKSHRLALLTRVFSKEDKHAAPCLAYYDNMVNCWNQASRITCVVSSFPPKTFRDLSIGPQQSKSAYHNVRKL